MSVGTLSYNEMEVALTKVAVDASNGGDRVYSFMLSLLEPITNILEPSFENAMPCGKRSLSRMEVALTKVAVDASNGGDRVYSFMLSLLEPITNILEPSFENAMPCGKILLVPDGGGIDEDCGGCIKGADNEGAVCVSVSPPGSIVSFSGTAQSCRCLKVLVSQDK